MNQLNITVNGFATAIALFFVTRVIIVSQEGGTILSMLGQTATYAVFLVAGFLLIHIARVGLSIMWALWRR